MRIKSWKARVIQSGALGARRECLLKLVVQLKHNRIDDDAGVSPTRRRTKCEVRRDSCARQFDDKQCNQFPSHAGTVADEQCPQFKVVCSL